MIPHQAHNNANANANISDAEVFVGYYQVPSSGKYFLEITMLLCNSMLLEPESSKTGFKGSNISCLEDPKQFRITSIDAQVIVTTPSKDYNQTVGFGSWMYQDKSIGKLAAAVTNTNVNVNSTAVTIAIAENQRAAAGQLFTRYQPQGCRLEDVTNPICKEVTSVDKCKLFKFQWKEKTASSIQYSSE